MKKSEKFKKIAKMILSEEKRKEALRKLVEYRKTMAYSKPEKVEGIPTGTYTLGGIE